MLIQKAEPRVERANVWIKHRGNSTGYPKLDNGMPILLNIQLKIWEDVQKDRLKMSEMNYRIPVAENLYKNFVYCSLAKHNT